MKKQVSFTEPSKEKEEQEEEIIQAVWFGEKMQTL